MLLPPEHNLPAFSFAKNILEKHLANTMEVIEMCSCDRYAYFDCESPPLRSRSINVGSHRSQCPMPRCGLSRYVDVMTPYGLKRKPRKVMYYMPLRHFLQDVFRKPEVVSELHHDVGERPPGVYRYI